MPEKADGYTSNKDKLKDIMDKIEVGIKEVFESGRYEEYLKVMSRFHNYSFNNTLLIYMQKPNATCVAGFNKWKDKFERTVNKGEKGIKIIAPTPYKKKIEKDVIDPDTKLPMLDENGKPLKEEKEVSIPMFKPVTVFDVSQTSGKELPTLAAELKGNVENFDILKEAICRSAPVPVSFKPLTPNTDGFFSPRKQEIVIREGMSEIQSICALIHETAHSKLHNPSLETEDEEVRKINRATQEVEAESIAYTVCAYLGIETGENSFGYLAAWSKSKELNELKSSLDIISKTSSELINDIEKNYKAIVKERGIGKDEQKEADDAELKDPAINVPQADELADIPVPDPAISKEALLSFGYTDANMLPVTQGRAIELFVRDIPVYCIYQDDTEAMADTFETINSHEGMFAVDKNDWAKAVEKERQTEKEFTENAENSFALYQLHNSDGLTAYAYRGIDELEQHGLSISKCNYDLVATGKIDCDGRTTEQILDTVFDIYNVHLPADYRGRSCSVSDIIAIKLGDDVSSYYVDRVGFTLVSDFIQQKNHLKSAEILTEDDYGMIDGIINNGSKTETEKTDTGKSDKKQSVLKKLDKFTKQANSVEAPAPKKTERNLIQ